MDRSLQDRPETGRRDSRQRRENQHQRHPGPDQRPQGQKIDARTGEGTVMAHNLYDTLQEFRLASGETGKFYSLQSLEKAGIGRVSRLPVSIRIVLESVLRNCDG